MAVRFGVFVPQGWRRDLLEFNDFVEQFEAMTAVARAVDEDPAWDSIWVFDHFHTVPLPLLEVSSRTLRQSISIAASTYETATRCLVPRDDTDLRHRSGQCVTLYRA